MNAFTIILINEIKFCSSVPKNTWNIENWMILNSVIMACHNWSNESEIREEE